MTWADLEDEFSEVQQDWAKRELSLDWQFMTDRYKEFQQSTVTFNEYSSWLFKRVNDFYYSGNLDSGANPTTVAIVLLVSGIVLFLVAALFIKVTLLG